ncbi:MAG TPA: FliM/FliN family flagellar motor switch protein [Bryobacteraceae bacterium]|nr:FliM/FliN family flagellar motor switch protein [Bryobacteraceae bacterium]
MSLDEQIAHIADVPVEIEVQLDRRWMKLSEILELSEGSVLEMRRSAGENIDIYVGSKLLAYGEIVIIENIMGVRITDFPTGT